MNQMPTDWTEQIRTHYPKRSGPCGWGGMKLMLSVRRALIDTTWETIIEGIKRYAVYCQLSGKDGSDYVLSPKSFFEDAIYAEEFEFKQAEDPKIVERRQQETERRGRVENEARQLGFVIDPRESTGSLVSRIMLVRNSPMRAVK